MDLDNLSRVARREVISVLRDCAASTDTGESARSLYARRYGADALERELTIGRELGAKLKSRGETWRTWCWSDARLLEEIMYYAAHESYSHGAPSKLEHAAFAAANGRGLDVAGAVEHGIAAGLARSAEERDPDTWIADGTVAEDLLEFKVSSLPLYRQSRTGYGDKIPTSRMVRVCGRWRRVYCTIWSNSGSQWFILAGQRIVIW